MVQERPYLQLVIIWQNEVLLGARSYRPGRRRPPLAVAGEAAHGVGPPVRRERDCDRSARELVPHVGGAPPAPIFHTVPLLQSPPHDAGPAGPNPVPQEGRWRRGFRQAWDARAKVQLPALLSRSPQRLLYVRHCPGAGHWHPGAAQAVCPLLVIAGGAGGTGNLNLWRHVIGSLINHFEAARPCSVAPKK